MLKSSLILTPRLLSLLQSCGSEKSATCQKYQVQAASNPHPMGGRKKAQWKNSLATTDGQPATRLVSQTDGQGKCHHGSKQAAYTGAANSMNAIPIRVARIGGRRRKGRVITTAPVIITVAIAHNAASLPLVTSTNQS